MCRQSSKAWQADEAIKGLYGLLLWPGHRPCLTYGQYLSVLCRVWCCHGKSNSTRRTLSANKHGRAAAATGTVLDSKYEVQLCGRIVVASVLSLVCVRDAAVGDSNTDMMPHCMACRCSTLFICVLALKCTCHIQVFHGDCGWTCRPTRTLPTCADANSSVKKTKTKKGTKATTKQCNRLFPEITGEDNLTAFSYSGRVKSPERR